MTAGHLEFEESLHFFDLGLKITWRPLFSLQTSWKAIEPTQVLLFINREQQLQIMEGKKPLSVQDFCDWDLTSARSQLSLSPDGRGSDEEWATSSSSSSTAIIVASVFVVQTTHWGREAPSGIYRALGPSDSCKSTEPLPPPSVENVLVQWLRVECTPLKTPKILW